MYLSIYKELKILHKINHHLLIFLKSSSLRNLHNEIGRFCTCLTGLFKMLSTLKPNMSGQIKLSEVVEQRPKSTMEHTFEEQFFFLFLFRRNGFEV